MSSRLHTAFSYAARREVIARVAPEYRASSLAHKALLLDQVVAVTGSARTYTIGLLNHLPEGTRSIVRPRLPR